MLKNLSIGKKLLLTFIFVAVICSAATVVGLIQMTNLDTNYSYALNKYGFAQGDIGVFHAEFNYSCSKVKDLIISTDSKAMNQYADELAKENANVDTYLAKIGKSMDNAAEQTEYKNIKDDLAQYRTISNQVVALAKQNKKDQAQTLLTTSGIPLSDKIKTSVDSLIREYTTEGEQIAKNLSTQRNVSTVLIVVILVLAVALSLSTAVFISRGISKPVKEMAAAAQQMAKGNLNVQIQGNGKDEIGQLGEAFAESSASIRCCITDLTRILGEIARGNLTVAPELDYVGDYAQLKNSCDDILASLNDTLGQINQAAEQVSSGSSQVSDGAQALAQGAAQQAGSIEELSKSITEVSIHGKKNVERTAEANTNVDRVRSEIETSSQYMNDMVHAMSLISDSSNQIGNIIKTIEDIAFQTNILALNASVEAARAGAAGKGFAVVADEVRNLAGKSSAAAKDTAVLIENCIRQMESGTRIADKTAKSLLQVVESTKAVSDIVNQISEASGRQTDAVGQVMQGVDQISAVVQTNSATAEESAAASEELSGQAQALKALIQQFQLRSPADQNDSGEAGTLPLGASEFEISRETCLEPS